MIECDPSLPRFVQILFKFSQILLPELFRSTKIHLLISWLTFLVLILLLLIVLLIYFHSTRPIRPILIDAQPYRYAKIKRLKSRRILPQ